MFRALCVTGCMLVLANVAMADTPPECSTHATIHASGPGDSEGYAGGIEINGSNFLASRFHVDADCVVTAVGGQLTAGSAVCSGPTPPGTIFAAIVELDGPTGVP